MKTACNVYEEDKRRMGMSCDLSEELTALYQDVEDCVIDAKSLKNEIDVLEHECKSTSWEFNWKDDGDWLTAEFTLGEIFVGFAFESGNSDSCDVHAVLCGDDYDECWSTLEDDFGEDFDAVDEIELGFDDRLATLMHKVSDVQIGHEELKTELDELFVQLDAANFDYLVIQNGSIFAYSVEIADIEYRFCISDIYHHVCDVSVEMCGDRKYSDVVRLPRHIG